MKLVAAAVLAGGLLFAPALARAGTVSAAVVVTSVEWVMPLRWNGWWPLRWNGRRSFRGRSHCRWPLAWRSCRRSGIWPRRMARRSRSLRLERRHEAWHGNWHGHDHDHFVYMTTFTIASTTTSLQSELESVGMVARLGRLWIWPWWGCGWLYQEALYSRNPYWWDRYNACVGYY